MTRVFIDPGHGGKDPGAIGNGLQEKDIVLKISLKVGEILKRHNVEVIYSRTADTFRELFDRANMANKVNADIFVSMHINAFTSTNVRGVETFSHTGSTRGAVLAKNIQDQLALDKIFTVNRGTKTANFAVLRLTNMPAVLVELGFISNYYDAEILRKKQSEIAESIAKGILNYLDIKYVENNIAEKYEDIPSDWAKEAWEWGIKNGITDGTRPMDAATREELITMLYRFKEVK